MKKIMGAWVVKNYFLDDVAKATLTELPSRERWFSLILPELDFEIPGDTWDDPKWAWEDHPWFSELGLTKEECEYWFEHSNTTS